MPNDNRHWGPLHRTEPQHRGLRPEGRSQAGVAWVEVQLDLGQPGPLPGALQTLQTAFSGLLPSHLPKKTERTSAWSVPRDHQGRGWNTYT